jgi:hypothetical protein
MKALVLVTTVVVAMAVSLPALEHGQAAPAASRIIDRTAVCQMPGEGFPDVTSFATVSVHDQPPLVSVTNGPSYEVRAGLRTRASGRERTGAATLNREACTTTTRRVVFSTRGLRRLSRDSATCDVPATVRIRLQARFTRPTGWLRDRKTPILIHAKGTISTGSLMVTTLAGRPVAYATVNNVRGKAQLFVARALCLSQ